MANLFDLTGKVAIVTGTAQGLGFAIARALAEQGANLALLDVQAEAVAAASAQLNSRTGRQVLGLMCDTRQIGEVHQCIDAVVQEFGRIDILVNNAGIHRRGAPIEFEQRDLTDVFDVNLKGCFYAAGADIRLDSIIDRNPWRGTGMSFGPPCQGTTIRCMAPIASHVSSRI